MRDFTLTGIDADLAALRYRRQAEQHRIVEALVEIDDLTLRIDRALELRQSVTT